MFTYASLYDEMIDKYPNGNFAEVGCWFGDSSEYLLKKLLEKKSKTEVTFVDSWIGGEGEPERTLVLENGFNYVYDKFLLRTISTGYPYKSYREFSALAPKKFSDEVFDFVFIDAGHQGWQCYDDMVAWYPKLRSGGTMAGHDIEYIDVERSVERFAKEYNVKIDKIGSPVQCWRFVKELSL